MSPQRQKRANSGPQAVPPEQQVPVVGQAPAGPGAGAGNAAAQEALKGKVPGEAAQAGGGAQGGPAQAVPAKDGAAPNQGGAQAELRGAGEEEADAGGPTGTPAQRQAGAPPADPTAGPTPAGPEAAAPAAAAPAVAAAAVDQGQAAPGEAQPKSEAEIDQAIAGVQGKAQVQAPGEAKGEDETAKSGAQDAAAQGQGGAPGAGQEGAPGAGNGPAVGGKGPAVAPAQGGGGAVPFAPWSGLKGGFPWDQELAMRELFRSQQGQGGAGAGGGAAPAAPAQQPMSRLELVGQALGGGAMAGAKEGAVSVVIDTAINMASSKIPYLSGFVEMGRLIYDPKKYGEDTLKGLTGGALGADGFTGAGKFGSGWAKVTSGNPIDMIEGVLDWGDAVAGIIATLSNICWIVAGLGFILSWIPGMQWLIPFVALTAKWAMLLGTIGTAINLGLSVLRLLVMGLRTLDILYLESDPEAARAKAAGLQEQTTKFTQDFVQRAGDSARGRLSGHLAQKGQQGQQGQGNNPAPSPAPAPASPPPAWSRALGIMTGSFGTEHGSAMGSGFNATLGSQRRGEVREDFDNTLKATNQARARGQSTGDRIAGLEANGVQVYVGDRHRDYTNRRLEKRMEADPTLELAPARKQLAAAQADYDKAKAERSRTRDELDRAQAELTAAQQRLREAQARGGPTEAELKTELAFRKQLLDSYDQDVRTARAQGDEADARFNAARALQQQDPSPENLARMQGALADKQRALESQRRAIAGQHEAAELHLEGMKQLYAVQSPPAQAQIAEQRRNEAQGKHSQAEAGAEEKRRARSRARNSLQGSETPTALKAEQQWQERQQARADYKGYLDFKGDGPAGDNGPFGHNRAEGVMGAGTGLLVTMAKDKGLLADPEKMAKPGEGRAIGPDYDLFGGGGAPEAAAAGNPGAEAAKARVQAAMNSLSALPAAPMGAPNQVDGAYAAYQSLDAEEQRLKGQKVALAEGKAIGAQTQAELQGGAAVLDGARQTGAAIQAEADAKLAKQQELSSKAGEVGAKATEGGGKAGESQGLLGSFIGGFLGLMSKIPSRFVGNAGAGSAGAQRLGQAPAQMTGGASTGGAAAAAMSAAAATQGAQTQEAKAQTTAAQGQIDANKATITTKQTETQTGVAEMTQADTQADAELARIAAEKERLKAEHQAAGSGAGAWATGHAASRVTLQAELAAAVAAAEALQGGGAGQ